MRSNVHIMGKRQKNNNKNKSCSTASGWQPKKCTFNTRKLFLIQSNLALYYQSNMIFFSRWSIPSTNSTSSSTFITAMDENITYDQLPVMSPMMASNSNESGNGGGNGQTIMDDGRPKNIISKSLFEI